MSIKENVDYVKDELSSQEKFLENFVKGERFYKKYRTLIFAFIAIVVLGTIGIIIKKNIDESNKLEANLAFNKVLENSNDAQALEVLKNKNPELYEVALFLQAKKDNKPVEVNVPLLKELSKYQIALENKNIEDLNNLSMQNDFLLKEFAIFNKALLLSNAGKYEEAKTALKLDSTNIKSF
ncbi:MAG: hypothetical protein U5K55_01565 [Aliarcobacter sp.]|nr:hypothetical protein [Aliarcobacter sp.]